jgi:hypothetical protein
MAVLVDDFSRLDSAFRLTGTVGLFLAPSLALLLLVREDEEDEVEATTPSLLILLCFESFEGADEDCDRRRSFEEPLPPFAVVASSATPWLFTAALVSSIAFSSR